MAVFRKLVLLGAQALGMEANPMVVARLSAKIKAGPLKDGARPKAAELISSGR